MSISPLPNDDTLSWIQSNLVDEQFKPSLILRAATDTNYLSNQEITTLPGYGGAKVAAKAMMNSTIQGTTIPVMSWTVSESIDQVTDTAQFDTLNVLPRSTITTKIASGTVPQRNFNPTPTAVYAQQSSSKKTGFNGEIVSIGITTSAAAQNYTEADVIYRIMAPETFTVTAGEGAKFPDPRVPLTERDTDIYHGAEADPANDFWPASSTGVGSYFLLIDNEVVRVYNKSGDTFYIPAGGRAVNGVLEAHSANSKVTLLGFAPFDGSWVAPGYLTWDSGLPAKSLLAPGNCFVSYEGYGAKPSTLHKNPWQQKDNMVFTGYWFAKDQTSSLSTEGQMKLSCSLASAGYILSENKINAENILALKNTEQNWAAAAFDYAGSNRDIPGDWVDYNSWDPSLKGSYPLQVKTEIAQHQAFFDHMSQTEKGKTCALCQGEYTDYLAAQRANNPTYLPDKNPLAETRAVGKHVYKESIRVYNAKKGTFNGGPLNTFLRLFTTLAQMCWEHAANPSPIAQRWTKIPQRLWTSMQKLDSGLVANSRFEVTLASDETIQDWSNLPSAARTLKEFKTELAAPFEAVYDNQPWDQPARDLADLNHMQFLFNRAGYPVFMPKNAKLRGVFDARQGLTTINTGEWFLDQSGSIQSFQQNFDLSSIATLCYVNAQSAFKEAIFTVAAAGTSASSGASMVDNTRLVTWYSSKTGNVEGLKLTGGVQRIQTVSMDNIKLGLSWNMSPAGLGLRLIRPDAINEASPDGYVLVDPRPGELNIQDIGEILANQKDTPATKKAPAKVAVKTVQSFINFMIMRRYINTGVKATNEKKKDEYVYVNLLDINGTYGNYTQAYVPVVKNFMDTESRKSAWIAAGGVRYTTDGTVNWSRELSAACAKWLQVNKEYIETDVWWYVQNGYDWEYYIATLLGLPIPQYSNGNDDNGQPLYQIDNLALSAKVGDWMRDHIPTAIGVGNKVVDDSILRSKSYSIQAFADPRILVGDVLWVEIPGLMSKTNSLGNATAPFKNGVYLSGISRTMNLETGEYNTTYIGYPYVGTADVGLEDGFFYDVEGTASV